MYTKFYDNTITTKFIKNLVSKTNVPFISTWKPGDFAIRGMLYLTRDAIWKCQHTGFPASIDSVCTKDTHNATLYKRTDINSIGDVHHSSEVQELTGQTASNIRYFTRVSPYVFGKEYYNITGRYSSNVLGYDATTHLYLGQYLRMMRDVYDLDLMPFYNCYANEVITDIDFNDQAKVEIISNKKNQNSIYKILSVPVRFGKTYMLALNSETPIEVMCIIYGKKGLLQTLTTNLNDSYSASGIPTDTTYKKFQRMQFKTPVLYKTPNWTQVYNKYLAAQAGGIDYSADLDFIIDPDSYYDQTLGQFEKNLRLIIKVPKTNKSSIVVIEGDYPVIACQEPDDIANNYKNITWSNQYLYGTTINSKTVRGEWIRPQVITSKDGSATAGMVVAKEPLFSPLSLLQISDGNTYAFSNRLVEYLTQNAINHLESFSKNIERVQQYSKSDINYIKNGSRYSEPLVLGVWDKDFQRYLFNLVRTTKLDVLKTDLTGYVDKSVEKIISRGQKQ